MKDKKMDKDDPQPLRRSRWRSGEERALTTDERASFVIVSLYMVLFCVAAFMYWNSVLLKIIGITVAVGGVFLFVAAFFDTEATKESNSRHPLRSYLLSLFITLLVLFAIRFVTGVINSTIGSMVTAGLGLLIALVVFRKALVQVGTTLLAVVFLFVTISNRHDVLVGHMTFKDAARQCGQIVFQIGPIQDIVNLLLSGNYMGYLSRIDYHNEQINILATRLVADSNDDEVIKTQAILDFVSNDIRYISDPGDGVEFAKDPVSTLVAGGGDCEDQTLLLCSMLETVGVKTYIAFTDDHVFALAQFAKADQLPGVPPYLYIDGQPCHALDPSDPGAVIGSCSVVSAAVKRVFDVRRKAPINFSMVPLR